MMIFNRHVKCKYRTLTLEDDIWLLNATLSVNLCSVVINQNALHMNPSNIHLLGCLSVYLSVYRSIIFHFYIDAWTFQAYWLINILDSLNSFQYNTNWISLMQYWIYLTTIRLLDILFSVLSPFQVPMLT